MTLTDVVVGLAILVGLIGIIVPVLPGSLLVLLAILAWAGELGTREGWIVFALAATAIVLGNIVKFTVPGKKMRTTGVPRSTLWFGALVGIVGFFVIPVVGLFLGFVLGVYLAEHRRVGREDAWPATVDALKAVGVSILIELAATTLAAAVWLVGVFLT